MASYDIIGGIVSPKALEELKQLELQVSAIAEKLSGLTLGQASSATNDAALLKKIDQLEAKIKSLTETKKRDLDIGSKAEQQLQRQQQKYAAIANSTSQYVTSLQKMEAQMKILNIELQKLVANGQTESKVYLEKISALKKLSTEYDMMAKASGQAQMKSTSMYGATFQLTQVMRELPNFAMDARIGFMSLSNNLPMLTDSFSMLSKQINGTTGRAYGAMGAFKIFARSLLSMNTIMVLASTLLVLYGKDLLNWIASVTEAEKAQKSFIKSIKDGTSIYSDATKEINRLDTLIDLSNKGFIDGKKVLAEYNSKLSDTLGVADTLSIAQQILNNKGGAYIELMFKMQKANIFLQESNALLAKSAALAADDTINAFDKTWNWIKNFVFGVNSLINSTLQLMSGNIKGATYYSDQMMIHFKAAEKQQTIIDQREEKSNEIKNKSIDLLNEYKLAMEDVYSFANENQIDILPKNNQDPAKTFAPYNEEIAFLMKRLDELNQMIGGETAEGYQNSIKKRLNANELFFRASMDLLEEQKKEEQALAKGNADELKRIEDEYYLKSLETFRDYKREQVKILREAEKDIETSIETENNVITDVRKTAIDGWLDMQRKARENNIKDAKEAAEKELQIQKKKDDLVRDLVRESITAIIEITNNLYTLYFQKLEEQKNQFERIENEKLLDIKDKEAAGVLTKAQAEEEKARVTSYYASIDEELRRKKEEAEKRNFLINQAFALAEVWINYAKAVASVENLLANGLLTPLYTGIALASTGIIAAQTIPMFAEGGTMDSTGKAVLGDGRKKELGILPDGRMFITPDKPTIYDLPKGTHILPDVNSIDIRSLMTAKQIMPSYSGNNSDIVVLKSIEKAIKSQKGSNFYGMPLIKQISQSDRYSYRKRGLIN